VLLICGLGNRGPKYAYTRHNLGYLAVERFSERSGISLKRKALGCTVGSGSGVMLAKADTYMNLSGGPLAALMRYQGIEAGSLIVVHDDLDMEFGRMKIRWDGRDGGHKGVRSVIESIGTPDFFRFKVGIGRDPAMLPEDYVLSRFSPGEAEALGDILDSVAEALDVFIKDGSARAMSMYNNR
jgi:peptidyl-tRNA hydrolase, PTH1 family